MDGGFDLDALLRPVRAQRADPTGQVLSGCRLERVLGRGAMGEAWLARREADGQPVVVKLLDPVALADAERRARARREWATLCKVRPTPHVVQVLGVDLEHERPHLVLELVPGEGLHALLRRRGRLPWSDAARVARDLALGLAAVHEQGVVHRDVKPANAIVRPDGAATLVDFGLAKDLFATSVTSPQMILGTAAYMAPEQWADAATRDGRCDLFALGATLYELVAGAPPFGAGQDPAAVEEAATTGDYAPLEEAAPGAPAELALVVDLLLAPDPAWRYPRADLVARDLEAVLRGGACSAPCLLAADGRRWPLVRGRRWTLGSAPDCQVPLPPPASPRHAQLRREAAGYTLVDLRGSAGTRVQGAPLAGPRALAPGDALDLAGVALRFVDPLRTAPVAATEVVDARREVAPAPLVQALAAEADPRAAAWLLERLAPDPAAAAATRRALAGAGAEAVRVALEARAAEDARAVPWAAERLAAITGAAPGDPAAALAWWVRARGAVPLQVAPPGPPSRARLLVTGGAPAALDLAGRGVVLVGREPRCDVALAAGRRLAATLVRLHARWVLRDEGDGGARLLEPGRPAALGEGAALLLEMADDPPDAGGLTPLDPAAFWALAGRPATLRGLAAVLALGPALEAALARLAVGEPVASRARALLADRARLARERLALALGRDLGDDPAAWRAAVGAGPGLAPAGWTP